MKRKWIRYLSCLLCLLFAAGIGLSAKMPSVWAEGDADAAGITYRSKNMAAELGTAENPFTILEIVPNKSMGMIGYMIPGCEPADMEKVASDEVLKWEFEREMVGAGFFRQKADGTGFENADCLIPAVFDEASSYGEKPFISQVVTMTPDELTDENLQIIWDADMISISAKSDCVKYWEKYNWGNVTLTEQQRNTVTFTGANGNDISWNAALAIVERMASSRPAAMFLQSYPMWDTNTARYNMNKLYLMLMQYAPKNFWNKFVLDEAHFKAETVNVDGKEFLTGTYWNEEMGSAGWVSDWNTQTFLTKEGVAVMQQSDPGRSRYVEVYGSILSYENPMNVIWSYLKPGQITPIGGNGNDNNKLGSNQELFDYYEQLTGTRPDSLSMNQAVHYILQNAIGSQKRIRKLHVLEISPCSEFIYGSEGWESAYTDMLPGFVGDFTEDLTVTTMPIYEFIGDITDINSEYDMIIFNAKQDASNGANGYNDKGMPPNQSGRYPVYTGMGDLVTATGGEWSYGGFGYNYRIYSGSGSDAYQLKARYSGNDLTKKKYEELRDFLAAGKPIIMPKELYHKNENKYEMEKVLVDESSYLYQLGKMVYQPGINESTLFRYGNYKDDAGKDRLKGILAKESCKLNFPEDGSGIPTPYGTGTSDGYAYVMDKNGNVAANGAVPVAGLIQSTQYNEMVDAGGNPVLRYAFSVSGAADAVYGVRLYLDRNGDGVYGGSIREAKEFVAAGQIVPTSGNEEVSLLQIVDMTDGNGYGVTDGNLFAGHNYVVTCQVPASERGILSWKIELYNRNNDSIRSCATGYTAVRTTEAEREKIKVLQMNLLPNMKYDGTPYVNFADQTTVTGAKFAAYLAAVPDFDVQISYMKNSDWYALYGEGGSYAVQNSATKEELIRRWEDYLDDVDMLIIGFQDMTSFTNDEVFYAGFMNFVDEGKSVILSHDLVNDATFFYREPTTITDYDAALRTLAGQRRKYYVPGTNYYRYNRTVRNSASDAPQSQSGNTLSFILDRQKFYMEWAYLLNKRWGEEEFGHYYSKVKTNIPETVQESYALDAGTYEEGGTVYRMDYGSEFMDNSVRLLVNYGAGAAHYDRVLRQDAEIAWPKGAQTNWVAIANGGQITNYPYMLGDTIQVTTTHAQNFQLDLEQDNEGDVTVWYNLTDGYDSRVSGDAGTNNGVYSSRAGDSRNNYYMYTKGNITYTGLGHSRDPLTDDEVKLFVNTMVSAYRVVPKKPYVQVTEEDASFHDNTYTMYIMMTGAEVGSDVLDVDFIVQEEGLTEGMPAGTERRYYLQYQDEDGKPLEVQPEVTVRDGTSKLEWDADAKRYAVSWHGKYSFGVPYQQVLTEGQAVYYVELRSEYTVGNKTIETRKTTRVEVYAMPLFTLH